jgi:hypothetical protein
MVESGDTQQKKGYWQKRNNWIRLLTLLAVLTYTGIQAYQTHLIYKNNIVSQRAFVYIDMVKSTPYNFIDPKDKTVNGLGVLFHLVHSWNTPTKNLITYTRCAPSVEDLPEPWVLLYRGTTESVPGVIGPHATITSLCGFTPSEMKQISDKTMYGYLLGDISYHDQLDWSSEHRTQFSFKIVDLPLDTNGNVAGMRTGNVGRHNCADEECAQN